MKKTQEQAWAAAAAALAVVIAFLWALMGPEPTTTTSEKAWREARDRLNIEMQVCESPNLHASEAEIGPAAEEPLQEETDAADMQADGPRFTAAGSTSASEGIPADIGPLVDLYLRWEDTWPEGYANLIRWGRGEQPPLPVSEAKLIAAEIAYDGYRWDTWIAHRLGPRAEQSPYYGLGKECARYLRQRGRTIENALATLEAESTYGLGGSLHFGILVPGYPNTLEGYCDLLDTWSDSNDPWAQACFWNMPGYPRYQQGFVRIVEAIKSWRP